jgi:hypothetical protein
MSVPETRIVASSEWLVWLIPIGDSGTGPLTAIPARITAC